MIHILHYNFYSYYFLSIKKKKYANNRMYWKLKGFEIPKLLYEYILVKKSRDFK